MLIGSQATMLFKLRLYSISVNIYVNIVVAVTCDVENARACIVDFERYTVSHGYNASLIAQSDDDDDAMRMKYSDYCRLVMDFKNM